MGKYWIPLNDDRHRPGLVLQIAGYTTKHERVYAGTHGRGIFYGHIEATNK